MSDRSDSQRAAFDDDRLLDYALGLEDDPELAEALSHSARLRERLADLKSDLAAIESELRSELPPIDDTYTELSGSRWSRLRRSLGEPEAVRRPRSGRRLTAALVAAALTLAVVIGLVTILPRLSSSGSSSNSATSGVGKSAAAGSVPAQPGVTATSAAASGATDGAAGGTSVVAQQAAAYRDVAVVRAGPLRGAGQGFTVVRTLKGSPPASFSLVLQAIGNAPQAGSLAIAYLLPVATTSPEAQQPAFAFDSQPALVVDLPAGVAAAAIRLP